jgi:NAD(P)-dependent dehydrogenase (short-subunit alcohol dehydrogenase family)
MPITKKGLAMVVGVGPGFGYAVARHLARNGFDIILVSRNAERLGALVEEIATLGVSATAYGCDATLETSVATLFSSVHAHHGVPDLVIYSIQNFGPGEAVNVEVSAFEDGWKHNCLGSFLVARAAARVMRSRQTGSIILVGSTSAMIGRAGHLNLAVGKFGQRAIAQVMARELWPHGIHVAHLVIDADITDDDTQDDGAPHADPEHIAQSVLHLHNQPRSAWTSEMDLRPSNESFWEHC